MTEPQGPCIWKPCVATWRHWHAGFPGGYDNPDDPDGPPIPFEGDQEPAVRDYNGAALQSPCPACGSRSCDFSCPD